MKKLGKWILLILFLVVAVVYTNRNDVKASEYPEWKLNETKKITLNSGESVSYSFTAPEDGVYAFWSDHPAILVMGIGMGWDLRGAEVYKHVYQENYQVKLYVLEAGKTYEMVVDYRSRGSLTKTFGIRKATVASSISFSGNGMCAYSGDSEDVYLSLSAPEAMGGTFTWTSSDPSVVKVARNKWSSAKLSYGNPGTATITVSNGSVSTSFNITVLAPIALQEGVVSSVDANAREEYYFTFTPGTSGKYLIKTNQMIGLHVQWPWDVQINCEVYMENGNQGIICPMAAGSTYTIAMPTVNAGGEVAVTIDMLSAQYVTPPTGYQEQKLQMWELILEEDGFPGVGRQTEAATFTATETGTYYMYYQGPLDDPWYVVNNGNVVPIEAVQTGEFKEVQHQYTFEAGQTYIMCNDAQWEASYVMIISREPRMSPPEEEGNWENSEENNEENSEGNNEENPNIFIPGESNPVDPDKIDSIIEYMPPGTKVEINPVEEDVVQLVVSQLEIAAEHEIGVRLTMNMGTIDMDYLTLAALGRFFQQGEVQVSFTEADKEALSPKQVDRLEEYTILSVLALSIGNEEGELHDFEGGSVVIRLPFEPEAGKRYHVVYVQEDGKIEAQPTNWEEGYIEFVAGHFSTFAIVEMAEDEFIEDDFGGILGMEGEVNGGANGVDSKEKIIGIVAAVVVAAAAVVANIISKKRKNKK